MAQSARRTETLVGFFLFVGLALLGTLVMQFGRFADRFRGVYTVTASFTDAAGVIKGSQIRLAGAKVGQVVDSPKLTKEGKVLVELAIREDTPPIDKNAAFQITSLSLLGDKAIMITPPPPDKAAGVALAEGDFIEGAGPSGLEALQSDAANIASGAAALMPKIEKALEDLGSVTNQLGQTIERVNNGLLADENMENISGVLSDLRGTAANIKEASLDIKPLIADAQNVINGFGQAAEEAQGTFAQASSEISKLGPALDKVPQAVDSIVQVADDASATLKSVKNSEGLLGTLAYDHEVKDDAATFLKNLRNYGILRYKDAGTFDERDPRNRFRGRRR